MSALALQLPRLGRRRALGSIACVLAGAILVLAAIGAAKLLGGSSGPASIPMYTGPAKAFRIALPSGWRALPQSRLNAVANAPTALIARGDRRALISVRPAPAIGGSVKQLSQQLAAQLRKRFPGFKPISARLARLRGGSALVYTFVRDPRGTVQTVAIAPAGGRLWELDAVLSGAPPQLARQTGAMLATFGS